MIEGLKPYAEYKESGLAWVPKIPTTWETARNGNLFQQRNETHRSELPVLEVSLRTGVRIRNFDTSKRKQVMADFGKYKRAAAGDNATSPACPDCGKPMRRRTAGKGPRAGLDFWGCSAYPECKGILPIAEITDPPNESDRSDPSDSSSQTTPRTSAWLKTKSP